MDGATGLRIHQISEAPHFHLFAVLITTTTTTTTTLLFEYGKCYTSLQHAHLSRKVKPNMSQLKEQVMVTRGMHAGVTAVCFSAHSSGSIRGRVVGNPHSL
jgi:hypothetical protein